MLLKNSHISPGFTSILLGVLLTAPAIKAEESLAWNYASDFCNGYATVFDGGKCACINIDGQLITPFEYDYIWEFHHERARVMSYSDGVSRELRKLSLGTHSQVKHSFYCTYYPEEISCKYGFIDGTGKLIVPVEYDYATDYYGGYSVVTKDGKKGLIDIEGDIVIPIEYDNVIVSNLSNHDNNGLVGVVSNNRMGFFDLKAREMRIPFVFDEVIDSQFLEGLAVVKKEGKYFYINEKGTKLTPDGGEWDGAFSFNKGHAVVVRDGIYYLINDAFDIVDTIGAPQWISIIKESGITIVGYSNNDWLILDDVACNGIRLNYYMIQECGNQYFIASNKDKTGRIRKGIIDLKGNVVEPIHYDEIYCCTNGFVLKRKNQWSYLDSSDGDINHVTTITCQESDCMFEGLARIIKRGKYGFVDNNGKVIIPNKYDYSGNFHDGRAVVMKNNKWGYIDKDGKALVVG